MPTNNLRLLALGTLLFCLMLSNAQNKKQNGHSKNYKKHPVWIEMMNDPQANYYETLKAFRMFWKNRLLPKEPFETEGAESFEREVGLINDKETEKEREREEKKLRQNKSKGPDYAAEVRAFKGWMQSVKPWLRADGSIISEQERQAIVDKQQQELRDTEHKNGKH